MLLKIAAGFFTIIILWLKKLLRWSFKKIKNLIFFLFQNNYLLCWLMNTKRRIKNHKAFYKATKSKFSTGVFFFYKLYEEVISFTIIKRKHLQNILLMKKNEFLNKKMYRVRHLTFFFQLLLISWMVTLSSCLIWQTISFPSNEYDWVYAWTTLGSEPAIDLHKMPILEKKNHIFRWSSKLSHLGHRKPARIHWKANGPKTSYCLVRILIQRHNWAIFLWK